jgi:2-polyprenyl-3-methyl-5-hydroxy-6-metoxy-1,4-benzoquinol methylase
MFEPAAWEERYSGPEQIWSGKPNTQLVAEASKLTPGTALDIGCGEGGDVIWLATHDWRVTGADFSAQGQQCWRATSTTTTPVGNGR